MKKQVLFIATTAVLLAGCAKEVEKPVEEQAGKLYTITAHLDNPETRTLTENDGTNKYKFSWGTGENISVVSVNPSSKLLFQVSDTENGTFTYQAKPDETYGGFGMAVTPGYALGENPTVNNYSIEFSGDYVYGQSNAIMIAGAPTVAGENYKFQFKHAAALVQVTYNNVPIGTKAMVLTSANNITGTATQTSATGVSIATGNLSGTPGKVAKVSFDEALTQPMSTAVFYVPIPIGSYQSFDIKLVNSSDVEIPGSAFTISAGSAVNVVVGNVLMFPTKTVVDFSGEWVLTGIKDDQVYACGKYTTGNNIKNMVAISVDAQQQLIEAVDGIEDCKITISRAANGLYVIQDMGASNNYWFAAGSGTNNYLKAAALDENNNQFFWSITEDNDGNHIITALSSNRNTIRFNSSDKMFSCYQSTSQHPVILYPYSWVRVDTTPQIIVAENEQVKSVTATTTSVDFAFSTKNITGAIQAAVTSDVNHIISGNPQVGNNTITVNLVPNEDNAAKTATITLSYEGAEDVVLTINQAAAGADPVTYSYTFTDKDWGATRDGVVEDWICGKSAATFESANNQRGVQVTVAQTGANAASPVSFNAISNITVSLAKSSSGAGSVEIMVGNQTVATQKTFNTSVTDYSFNVNNLSGDVKIVVTCSTNSIYVKGISITAQSTGGEGGGGEGTEVTFEAGTENSNYFTLEKDGVSISITDGDLSYSEGYRIYKNATLTVSAPSGKKISGIVFTYTDEEGYFKFSTETGVLTDSGVWSGLASSVSFQASNGQVRLTKVVVTYK